ncbi:class I SAM-dependent methyltransferase [Kitasatospora purpeofusca]|uniref:class I SAM-dependent methyltransferase n=1 Tax=Kitasatospora purpeofusca TaxID=67352 RepID=UPI002A5A258B|nr:class I SAM-dependent methyltransferase [Kitasatospora purpeofusca]MDY0815584.1 class I SAM-dependent methyltransferase [Kitasatospora purpeofusca]
MTTAEPEFLTATRTFYDAVAADYADRYRDALAAMPWDRALLGVLAELVTAAGGGRVADLGCGPGRITGHLADLGLDVCGLDLSPRMVELARAAHPAIPFETGSLLDLPYRDGELSGAVAWYSIIHTPAGELPRVFAEFRRVLAAGAPLLLAFQVGDDVLRLDRPFGRPVTLDFRRGRPERIEALAEAAGLRVTTRLVREPEPDERTPQAYLLAHRAA